MAFPSPDFQIHGTDRFELQFPIDQESFFKLVAQAAHHQMHVDDYCAEVLKALAEDNDDFKRFYTIGTKPADTNDNIAF
jgi:hypothetical protein